MAEKNSPAAFCRGALVLRYRISFAPERLNRTAAAYSIEINLPCT